MTDLERLLKVFDVVGIKYEEFALVNSGQKALGFEVKISSDNQQTHLLISFDEWEKFKEIL